MKRLFLLLLIPSLALSASSLSFTNTTDVANCGSNAILDNLQSYTYAAWLNPTALAASQYIFHKGADATGVETFLIIPATALTNFTIKQKRATTNSSYTSNNASLTINKWWYVAATFNIAKTPVSHIYVGSQGVTATETTYGTATDGVGATGDTSAANLLIGNVNVNGFPFKGTIGRVQEFNRDLTLAEIQENQFHVFETTNTVFSANLGFDGTGTQRDLSGNSNTCAITGATASLIGPPISIGGSPL